MKLNVTLAALVLLATSSFLTAQCPVISNNSNRVCSGITAVSFDFTGTAGCASQPASATYQEIDPMTGAPTGLGPITLIKAPGSCTATSYFKSTAPYCDINNWYSITFPAPLNIACNYNTADVLPIVLVKFHGRLAPDGVKLDWATASENENDFFVVEKSTDGIHFNAIAKIDGQGTSRTLKDYGFMDKTPSVGTNFYRLAQTDFDGHKTLSEIVSVQFKQKGSIFIAPNPAQDLVQISLPENLLDQDATILVHNMAGQLVFEKSQHLDQTTLPINLSSLEKGIYAVSLCTGSETFVRTVVLEK